MPSIHGVIDYPRMVSDCEYFCTFRQGGTVSRPSKSSGDKMPRIRRSAAELKNRVADSMIKLLDGLEDEMLSNPDEFGTPADINQACEIIRNALNRRKSA